MSKQLHVKLFEQSWAVSTLSAFCRGDAQSGR
ncbi:hypothetical protein C4K18_2947 [Pseudomonas chlororaphis subsp. aurantiaca]|nr:hypothetical protein C4K18_2947 [Pseudomonas chlororaphis subsp. aurantiaca]